MTHKRLSTMLSIAGSLIQSICEYCAKFTSEHWAKLCDPLCYVDNVSCCALSTWPHYPLSCHEFYYGAIFARSQSLFFSFFFSFFFFPLPNQVLGNLHGYYQHLCTDLDHPNKFFFQKKVTWGYAAVCVVTSLYDLLFVYCI